MDLSFPLCIGHPLVIASCFKHVFIYLWLCHGMWDLSSLTEHQTHVPCMEAWSPNHWTSR